MATSCKNSEKIVGKNYFPYHLKKIIDRYKKICHNIVFWDRLHAWLLNPIKVNNFALLFTSLIARRYVGP